MTTSPGIRSRFTGFPDFSSGIGIWERGMGDRIGIRCKKGHFTSKRSNASQFPMQT